VLQLYVDLNKIKEVFEAWWNKSLDRPLIQIFSPKDMYIPSTLIDSYAFLRYYPDIDKALDMIFEDFSNIIFWKEAFPNIFVNLGPGCLSAYLGAELKFDAHAGTAWFQGTFSLESLKEITFNSENKWWKYTLKCIEKALSRCQDAVVAFPDLLDTATVVGQLRGNYPTTLLKDMFTNRLMIKKVLERVHDIWFKCYDTLCEVMNCSENGYSTWAGLWSRSKHFVIQCDTIVYLSPKLFDDFIYPLIIEECERIPRTMWHLDGPLELNHLDKLLNVDELDAIQWIPGAGNPDAGNDCWVPLYKKILAKEKLLQIIVPSEKVLSILNKISPKGVAITAICKTEEEAANLIRELELKFK